MMHGSGPAGAVDRRERIHPPGRPSLPSGRTFLSPTGFPAPASRGRMPTFCHHPRNFAGAMEDLSSYTGWQKASVHERTARADTPENRGEANNGSGLVCELPRCRSVARQCPGKWRREFCQPSAQEPNGLKNDAGPCSTLPGSCLRSTGTKRPRPKRLSAMSG